MDVSANHSHSDVINGPYADYVANSHLQNYESTISEEIEDIRSLFIPNEWTIGIRFPLFTYFLLA